MMEDPINSYMRDLTLPDMIKRKTALRALGSTGDARAVSAIIALLDAKRDSSTL